MSGLRCKVIRPLVGFSHPASALNSVDLPAALGPTTAVQPGSKLHQTSCNTASAGTGCDRDEALAMTEQHKLMGRSVGFADVHLLASAKLSKARPWTRDKRLVALAAEF